MDAVQGGSEGLWNGREAHGPNHMRTRPANTASPRPQLLCDDGSVETRVCSIDGIQSTDELAVTGTESTNPQTQHRAGYLLHPTSNL